MGLNMKKLVLSTAAVVLTSASLAWAADLPLKAPPPVVVASPWDIGFGGAIASDYNFRGISQSDRKPSVNGYFEPRYNVTPELQTYVGIAGNSIDFPNQAAAEIDLYGGIRPTFGKLALDFGVWYYWYPGGRVFTGLGGPTTCTNLFFTPTGGCNISKKDDSFVEFYAKGTYTFNDNFAAGAAIYYDPSWVNTGAPGWYLNGNAKYTGTAFSNGVGWYVSGDLSHYFLGTTDAFYALTPLPDYTTWDIGIGFTYKVFTLDFRYYDTDLSKANCNVLTGAQSATFAVNNITALNPSGLGTNWCGAAFVVALKADLTLGSLK
jgi:Bacterial protein of unknown function (Gcw_chp)